MKKDEVVLSYRCADLYYRHDISQQEIANTLGISRPKVSRLLAMARELGIVTISLKPPELFNQTDLEKRLAEKYGLNHVLIGISKDNNDLSIQKAIGSRLVREFPRFLKKDIKIGIGLGSTIYETSKSIFPDGHVPSGISIYPLMGLAGRADPAYQINSIIDVFADYLSAQRNYFFGPAIFEDAEQKESFCRSNQVKEIIDKWEELDLAVFGIGGPIERSALLYSSFPEKILVQMVQNHAVGDVLAHFFDTDGNIACPEAEATLLSISFSSLKKIPERICLAGGLWKLNSIKTALESKLATILVTDLITAQSLIE
jgi:DNA-binding transcriptional regulator LsrR (DeoR family)